MKYSTVHVANNSLLMFKRQSANNEGGATAGDGSCVDEQLQKQAPSSWKAQQPPVMEIAAVDSKESKSSLHFAKRTDLEGRLDKGVRIPPHTMEAVSTGQRKITQNR